MMTEPAPARVRLEWAHILLVDDEPSVVAALRRQLHGKFIVHTATSPFEAIQMLDGRHDFAVVVSDMKMPSMTGAQLLKRVRERSPNTVRVLLTGQADMDAAVDAINDGWIFRFLWKPCDQQTLLRCLEDAVVQYHLIVAQRELQERTLRASIQALIDTLALANPTTFTRANRIRRWVAELARSLSIEEVWQIEIASMLAQLGTVSLPQQVAEQLHRGDELAADQQELVDRLPDQAVAILADIPRLGEVRDIIRLQRQRFDGRGPVVPGRQGHDIPIGSRILAVATAYDMLDARGVPASEAMAALRADAGRYDHAVLHAMESSLAHSGDNRPISTLAVTDLAVGMVLATDVKSADGVVLCGQGQEVTVGVLDRLSTWRDVVGPLSVYS